MDMEEPLSDEALPLIEKEMQTIIKERLAVTRKDLSRVEAIHKFKQEKEISLNSVNHKRQSALMMAVDSGNTVIIDHLLSYEQNMDLVNRQGNNAFMLAIPSQKFATLKKFLYYDIDLDTQNDKGRTALMLSVQKNNPQLATLLLEHNPDVNIADNRGNNALMYSITQDEVSITRKLLKNGSKLEHRNKLHKTALYIACETNNPAAVKMMIKYGADVNVKVGKGLFTPLFVIRNSSDEILQSLIGAGADPRQLMTDGRSPLSIAMTNHWTNTIKIMTNKQQKPHKKKHK
jgi:ankyrin repeat protein